AWTRPSLDLSAYADQTIQIAFHFVDDGGDVGWPSYSPTLSSGWYVDDVFVKRGTLAVASISDQTVNEHETLTFPVTVIGTTPESCVSYQLVDAPAGATIDPTTGVFSWTPSECQGPGTYNIGIYVVDYCQNEANDLGFVRVTVREVNEAPWLLKAERSIDLLESNTLSFVVCSGDPDCPSNPLSYSLLAPVPAGAAIGASSGVFTWSPTSAQVREEPYPIRVRLCDGGSPNLCVTNTVWVTVGTNITFHLDVQHAGDGRYEFTLLDGRADVDYLLQTTLQPCRCPCETVWEDVLRVSPDTAPWFRFEHRPADLGEHPDRYFRLKQVPRVAQP
ncbi:MAG TPA: putative Ig domain-containing protein, partial [Methylomirabilota bacterium]|nr:putative Ig domain-containing protein [Methylomirabilota bacterium]